MIQYIITTPRLALRQWDVKDTHPFSLMNMDDDVMKFVPKKLSKDETASLLVRIQLHFEHNGFGLFAVEDKATKQFVGFTGFSIPTFKSSFTPCVEIGWRFKKEFWGKGLAFEAASACLQYGFQTLRSEKIISFTSPLNVKSWELMQRLGMKYVTDFNHPNLEPEHLLCEHVLYELNRKDFNELSVGRLLTDIAV